MKKYIFMMAILTFSFATYGNEENDELNPFIIPIEPKDLERFTNFLKYGDPSFPSHWNKGGVLASIGDMSLLKHYFDTLNNEEIESLFVASAGSNNVEIMDFLLKRNVDVNTSDRDELTGLAAALLTNSQNTFALLVNAGADLHFVPSKGISNITSALTSYNYNEDAIYYLMKHKVRCDEYTGRALDSKMNAYSETLRVDLTEYCN